MHRISGSLLGSRLQGTAALQVKSDYRGFDQGLEGAGPSAPRKVMQA
jgi:hypothetical protein